MEYTAERKFMAARAVDARIRQYYSLLLSDVPPELGEVLMRPLQQRQVRLKYEPKIERIRPGGPPHVRLPSSRSGEGQRASGYRGSI